MSNDKPSPVSLVLDARVHQLKDMPLLGLLLLGTDGDAVVLAIDETAADRLIQQLHRFIAGEA